MSNKNEPQTKLKRRKQQQQLKRKLKFLRQRSAIGTIILGHVRHKKKTVNKLELWISVVVVDVSHLSFWQSNCLNGWKLLELDVKLVHFAPLCAPSRAISMNKRTNQWETYHGLLMCKQFTNCRTFYYASVNRLKSILKSAHKAIPKREKKQMEKERQKKNTLHRLEQTKTVDVHCTNHIALCIRTVRHRFCIEYAKNRFSYIDDIWKTFRELYVRAVFTVCAVVVVVVFRVISHFFPSMLNFSPWKIKQPNTNK